MYGFVRKYSLILTYSVLGIIVVIQIARTVSICDFTLCHAVPGAAQHQAAQDAAQRRGKDFALTSVLATPKYIGGAQKFDPNSLEVRFDFVKPAGDTSLDIVKRSEQDMGRALSITIEDTNPRTSLRILGGKYFSSQQPAPAFQRAISLVRISPAEALQTALQNAPYQSPEDKGDVLIGLYPHRSDEAPITPDTPAAWSILFLTDPITASQRVYVDAQTGEIVTSQEQEGTSP